MSEEAEELKKSFDLDFKQANVYFEERDAWYERSDTYLLRQQVTLGHIQVLLNQLNNLKAHQEHANKTAKAANNVAMRFRKRGLKREKKYNQLINKEKN